MPRTAKGVDLSHTAWQGAIKPNGKVSLAWTGKRH